MSIDIIKLLFVALLLTYSTYGKIRFEWFISCVALAYITATNQLTSILFNVLIIISSLNLPILLIYKLKTSDVLSNLLETNKNEALEQLSSLPIKGALVSIFNFSICIYLYNSIDSHTININPYYLLISSIIISASYPIRKKCNNINTFLLGFRFYFLDFLTEIYSSHKDYLIKKEEINEKLKTHKPYQWPESTTRPKYDNFILIIGESVRNDYMDLYGGSYPNTPFFSSTKKEYWSNFIAAGMDTLDAIPRLLSENINGFPDYNKNIIDLARSLGYTTHWLSNQGKFGKYENAITQYACLSDNQYFSNLANSVDSKIYDTVLLPELEKALSSSVKNFIVLHLLGSHSSFKNRIQNKPQFNAGSRHLDCYVQSIYETDGLLSKVHEMLIKTEKSFSMLYTSDHGLAHSDNRKSLLHGNVKECVQVPLVEVSSDMKSTNHNDEYMSGIYFMDFLKSWLNYGDSKPKYQKYEDVKVFYSGSLVNYSDLKSESE